MLVLLPAMTYKPAHQPRCCPDQRHMHAPPRIGQRLEQTHRVEELHAIKLEGLPPVLATPWLIWMIEHTALELLRPSLEPGEISVGVHVEWEHAAAALMGAELRTQARVIHHDGPVVTFQVEAHDDHERLGRGLHKRRVVAPSGWPGGCSRNLT